MLRNYLLVALRSLRRQKGYAVLNVAGLAVGMACGALILLYVQDELRYDRHHADADRIYRVVKDFVSDDGSRLPDATTPAALAPAMLREIPEVEQAARLFPPWGQQWLVATGDHAFYEPRVYRVDSTFFDVFTVPFLRGDARTAFAQPRAIVLTERMARKYFGDADPLGRTLTLNEAFDVTVTGVVEDVPPQSHFTYDFLVSIRSLGEGFEGAFGIDENWGQYNFYTYVRLRPGADVAAFEPKVQALYRRAEPEGTSVFYAQPLAGLAGIHLASNLRWELAPNGDRLYLYVFLTVALGVIAIACVNYVNLTTARSAQRAKEVGVRKVVGAPKGQLVRQFLTESLLTTLLAAGLAAALVSVALPFFNAVTGKALSASGAMVLGTLGGVALLCGLGAGAYPAFYLSAASPLAAFRGGGRGPRGLRLRQGLVVFQFAVSVVLLVGVLVVREQVAYVQTARLGFDAEQVAVVRNARRLPGRGAAFEDAVRRLPGVEAVSFGDGVPGGLNNVTGTRVKGGQNEQLLNYLEVGYDYADALDLELVAGRWFSPEHPSDSLDAIVLNETAVRQLGVPEPVLGQELVWAETPDTTYYVRVVGVVRDFHFTSLRSEIKPFAFVFTPSEVGVFAVELTAGADLPETMAALERAWQAEAPAWPFDAFFLDRSIDELYRAERNFGRVFSALTLLGLGIACLGLLGLAAYAAEQRTKEVGIRKALGARVPGLVALLTGDFLKLVAVAFALAVPLAYLAASRWLESFAYRVEVGADVFLLAGLLTAVIALAAVAGQALRAATADPVKALRYE